MSYNKDLAIHVLNQVENAILLIQSRTSGIRGASDFLSKPNNVEKLDAVCMQFIAIGESLKGLDRITNKELLSTTPAIPWNKIMGLRDIIAHHYFDVDAEQVWWIIDNELQPLLSAIRAFIEELSTPS